MSKRDRDWDDAPAPVGPKHSPDYWREALRPRASHHNCARIVHGWMEHEHHEGAPLLMTEDVYREALAAGQSSTLTPSPNALSPHRGRGR